MLEEAGMMKISTLLGRNSFGAMNTKTLFLTLKIMFEVVSAFGFFYSPHSYLIRHPELGTPLNDSSA